ncbi:MAG: dephospho-CoA kinase [Deltaproteobacteria bacterium]|nr:dephospho-CoA kinase [Deltaproteobacteria bacterium]
MTRAGRVVALTGGIGSGKSTVARLFEAHGAIVIDADQLARESVAPGSSGLEQVVARFGRAVLGPDGSLNRKALGEVVFSDPRARADLEAITHPIVAMLAAQRIADAASHAPLVLYDVPLFFERALARFFPEVIVVSASDEVRRQRVAARDALDAPAIEARFAAQIPLADKVARATWVIDNGSTLEDTRRQVATLFRALVAER